ncbi:MAG: thiol peroxidase [Planctomycetota bacterium]
MPQVTLKGNPVDVIGETVAAGQPAPNFAIQLADMSEATLATHAGKTRIMCAVPSLDTPVCDIEMKRFNEEAAALADTVVICVSMDLPMAQKRWCGANNAENIVTASDHRSGSFGHNYGCLVEGGPLDRFLCRAVFVIGADDTLKHVEYVSEIADEPDYAAALAAAKA